MKKSIDTIRVLSMDMINKANSGHPGVVLGFAPIFYSLFRNNLKITTKDPKWFNRDRFVLASGHASSMLYSTLHLCGYNISIDDLKQFRQLGSITPGHPEYNHTEGIDTTSGPLGQGIAMACGMAIAEKMLANKFNKDDLKIIDHYTFVECGDGDLQEGVTLEALQLIGRLKLNKLIILFDSNKIQLDGPVSNAGGFKNARAYFESLGFNYIFCENVEDELSVNESISNAKHSDLPTIIEFNTVIGYGSPLANSSKSHGSPLGTDNTKSLKEFLEYSNNEFEVSKEVYDDFKEAMDSNLIKYNDWLSKLEEYKKSYKEDYIEFEKVLNSDYSFDISKLDFELTSEASRKTIGKLINCYSNINKTFVAGSADLTASTYVKGIDGNFTDETLSGRNINYGVREHAMGAIANGLTLHGIKNMTGAFFVFSDYMKPAIRMAALMNIPSTFVFSHDSIAVGEDGPTHEPIEQMAGLRAIPNLTLFRPSDSYTTALSFKYAIESKGPSVILLTRQVLPLKDKVSYEEFTKGAYIRVNPSEYDMTLVASGSEVSLAIDVALELGNIRVVEMVSTNLYDKLGCKEKASIIDRKKPSMFIEMSTPYGLYQYADYVYAIDKFGASGNIKDVIADYGFTKEGVINKLKSLVKHNGLKPIEGKLKEILSK